MDKKIHIAGVLAASLGVFVWIGAPAFVGAKNLETGDTGVEGGATIMKKLTPILPVATILPSLPLWERLGFERTAQVPEEGEPVFVMLEKDGVEIMYQTLAGFEADAAALGEIREGGMILYIEVEDLAAVEAALGDAEVLIPRRRQFYGAEEVVVREAGGHIITFAQFDPQ